MKITFCLPGGGISGGIRVTVQMANHLLHRGHRVRIAYRCPRVWSRSGFRKEFRRVMYRWKGFEITNWLDLFQGERIPFQRFEELQFSKGEAVISAGGEFVHEILALDEGILKMRYIHGFPGKKSGLEGSGWELPMATLSVSEALVKDLEDLSGEPVMGVVPNGIDPSEYYVEENLLRDGIGTIYCTSYEKSPEDIVAILGRIQKRWPERPLYVFGREKRPTVLDGRSYRRYPSVSQSREFYNRSRVWLVLSRSEGFCLPILEAMACGSVVISTRHTNAGTLIRDGENGYLVGVGDLDAMMGKIEHVFSDDKLFLNMQAKGFATAMQYHWSRAVDAMESCLQRLSEGHSMYQTQ